MKITQNTSLENGEKEFLAWGWERAIWPLSGLDVPMAGQDIREIKLHVCGKHQIQVDNISK